MAKADALSGAGAASESGCGAPPPVVRLGGLPRTVLAELRCDTSAALAEQLLLERRSLASAAQSLTAALYQQIGDARGTALRPRLVGLRRSLHRLRQPASGEWSAEVRAGLPAPLVAEVDRWLARHQRLHHEQAQLPELLAREVAGRHVAMRGLAADPGFRRALWQSSRSLAAEVDKWLADPTRSLRPQTAFRLAKYLARAATKPSPLSTFAVSGFGRWRSDQQELRLPAAGTPTGVLELHGGLLERLLDGLGRHPQLWSALALRVNPSATEEDGRIWFLGRAPAEPLLSMPATVVLADCLELVTADPPARVGWVRRQLAEATGAGSATVDRLLQHLVQAGALEVWLDTGAASSELGAVAAWVRAAAGEGRLTDALDQIADALREPVPVAEVSSFKRRQESLRQSVEAVLQQFGMERPAGGTGPVAADTAVTASVLAECDRASWAPVLADLDGYRRWVAGFSPALPLRLALADWWDDRLGLPGEVPLLRFHHAIQRQLHVGDRAADELRRMLAGELIDLATSAFSQVRELHRWRGKALAVFDAAGQDDAEWQVTSAQLAAAGRAWPGWVPPVGSMGCYLQPLPSASELAVVLNAVDTGYGKGANRVGYLLRRAGFEPPVSGRPPAPGGPVLAELAGGHGSTLNHRLSSTPYTLDYPFTAATVGGPSASRRLPLADLFVARDPDRGLPQLRSRRLAAEVKALDLGLLLRSLLPPAARLLAQTFGELLMLRPPELLPALAPPPANGIRWLPRVWAGRVLLRRACWVMDSAAVPRRAAGAGDAEYLLQLLDWRDQAGIPSRCFVRLLPGPAGTRATTRYLVNKVRKPSYVDFASWLLVRGFENALVGRAGLVVFEEPLPDPSDTAAGPGPRVAELLIEVSSSDGSDGW